MLKLEEIQHYPIGIGENGLKLICEKETYKQCLSDRIGYLDSISTDEICISTGSGYYLCSPSESKPILYPLSSFGGKKNGGDVMRELNCSMKSAHEIWKLIDDDIDLKDVKLETYQVMCNNFIDFQDLIGQGKAISVYDLNVNPYK